LRQFEKKEKNSLVAKFATTAIN